MTKVYTVEDTRYYYTREPNPDDSWDAGDSNIDLSGIDVYTNGIYGEFEVQGGVGEKVHVVYVRYQTGNTFGFTSGEVDVLDVFDREEDAVSLMNAVNRFNDLENGGRLRNFSFGHNGKTYYANWVGYFETFESVDIEETRIQQA